MPSERPTFRYARSGEALAIAMGSHRCALQQGPQGFFWLFGGGAKASERREDVAIVHVRDALEHHDDSWSDNYESIIARVRDAATGEDAAKAHERRHRWDDDYQPIEATPPSAILLCIDSPGGVVSGLNECVKTIQSIRKETGIPICAYLNEMAASAAYAIACSCDRIVCPPSAIAGSVGVISTMISQSDRDKKEGFDVRLITSGARKADGHLHAPITDAALDVERGRVDKLALAFYRIVSKARGIPVATVRALEAGIFLGPDAEKRGLVDEVASLDDVVLALSKVKPDARAAKGNETDRRAAQIGRRGVESKKHLDYSESSGSLRHNEAQPVTVGTESDDMSLKIAALIKRTEAAIAAEKDPEKLKALKADLSAYKKTEKHVEHTKSEEYDDPDDDEDEGGEEDDDEEDDEEEEEDEKKSESKSKSKASEENEEDDAAASAKEKKAALSLYRSLSATLGMTGKSLTGAVAALVEKAGKFDAMAADVASLKATQQKAAKNALIDEAVAQRRITRKQAADLRGKKMSFVSSYLSMHKTAIVNIDEDSLLQPNGEAASDVPNNVKSIVEQSIQAMGFDGEKAKKFREESYQAHRDSQAKSGGMH